MDRVSWIRRHPIRSAVWLLALAVAVIVLVLWRVAASSDPVSDNEALAAFRSAPAGRGGDGPRPGVYSYAAAGSETGGAGPLAVTRDIPSRASLVVTPRPDGWEAEMSYSRQHVEAARYRVSRGEVRITWRRTKVTFAGFGRDDRRTVEPPSVFLPADLRVGATWRQTYRTGDLTVRVDSRVLRAEAVDVAGRDVPTLVISSRSITEGPHPGTRDETLWWAPSLRLPVRWDVNMDIGGTFSFRAETSLRLTDTTPKV